MRSATRRNLSAVRHFVTVGTTYSATARFDTVGEEFYREAIDLIFKEHLLKIV
jgi:hypothetical protein